MMKWLMMIWMLCLQVVVKRSVCLFVCLFLIFFVLFCFDSFCFVFLFLFVFVCCGVCLRFGLLYLLNFFLGHNRVLYLLYM